jgi:hypothetical protein
VVFAQARVAIALEKLHVGHLRKNVDGPGTTTIDGLDTPMGNVYDNE